MNRKVANAIIDFKLWREISTYIVGSFEVAKVRVEVQ